MPDCGVTDETLYRMKGKLTEHYGIERDIVRNATPEKMSEILLEYAKPFMDVVTSDSKEEYDKSIKIAMILWNCAIIESAKGSKGRKEIEKVLKPVLSDAESKGVLRFMLERKREMFPNNNRIIMGYELTETPDGFHLSVASTTPSI